MASRIQDTLVIIKPDTTEKNLVGTVLEKFTSNNLNLINIKKVTLTKKTAQAFYAIHKDKPFFKELVKFMTSGPCYPCVLRGALAIGKAREIIGNTNPELAQPGTIRAMYGTSKTENAVHGSDAEDTAKQEIQFFFSSSEVV